jgi:hypothetical protein
MTSPDVGIQVNSIPKTSLPYLDSDNQYLIRYRVKTSDGNLSTVWSPVYKVKKQSIEEFFNPDTGTHNANEREIKSHGKSIDVSWKIKSGDTVSIPEQINGLPLDAYVRWGGKITAYTSSGNTRTITVNYDHHFYVGQTVTVEGATEDQQTNYIVTYIHPTNPRQFQVVTSTPTNIAIGNRLWSRWEFIATITGNSFSVPIPDHHQSRVESGVPMERYAEFMVHLSTFEKDRQETTPETLIFYSESISTKAQYDAGSIL